MDYLIDSDWTINYLKGKENYVKTIISLLNKSTISITSVSLGEVLTGIYHQIDEEKRLQSLEDFLLEVRVFDFTLDTAFRFGRLRRELLDRRIPLENFDIAIAATAIEYNLTLLTDNLAHYERVKGLKLYSFPV